MSVNDLLIVDWVEAHSRLHETVEILYVVDGYEVQITMDRGPVEVYGPYRGATLREAFAAAMEARP